ncbi:unnamed protein product [Rotaria sp. Silwood1]|nr:unnamed protein product [Rotaria sp. Silwood1]
MWSIALLINTSSWLEFKHNWKLICLVFLKLHLGEEDYDRETQDALLEKINNIKSDTNTVDAIKSSEVIHEEDTTNTTGTCLYDFDDGADDDNDEVDKNFSTVTKQKIVIDEEQEANATNSPFKSVIKKIFHDALNITGILVEEAQGVALQSILKWFKYLTNFIMPTLPIWSNLDLTRHHRRIVQSFERVLIMLPQQQTTAISERRMGILKHTQLGGHIHIRLDIVLSILEPDMIIIINEFSNSLCNHAGKSINHSNDSYSMILDEQRLKSIEERWRQSCNKRGHGHYTKCPAEPVFTDLVSSLLACRRNVNAGLKLPSLSPDWLNIAICLILSIENNYHRQRISRSSLSSSSSNVSPLVDVIYTFIEEWLNDEEKKSRSTKIKFSSPIFELNDPSERSSFILEQILVPIMPCSLVVQKIYSCKHSLSTVKIYMTLSSILVNVIRSGLHLEHQLFSFFSKNSSDLLCKLCNRETIRHIDMLDWPPNINNKCS